MLARNKEIDMTRDEEWRKIALSFHRVAHHVQKGNLPRDFESGDLSRLSERVPLSGAEHGVVSFLLHIWDSEIPFNLAETQRWDEDHLDAFTAWVIDSEQPCRYF